MVCRRSYSSRPSYTPDSALLARPGNDEIQLDLFLDYASNVALYPEFQDYFRTHRPSLLAVWGKNDPFFLPSGAEAFKRDIPRGVVRFVDDPFRGNHSSRDSPSIFERSGVRTIVDKPGARGSRSVITLRAPLTRSSTFSRS